MKFNHFHWRPRNEPLPPGGMFAADAARSAALERLRALPEEWLSTLRGVYNASYVVLLGDAEQLPWIPGAVYLGQDDLAPSLWLPTALSPTLPLDLLDRAITQQFGDGQYMIDPWRKQCLPVTGILTVTAQRLAEVV